MAILEGGHIVPPLHSSYIQKPRAIRVKHINWLIYQAKIRCKSLFFILVAYVQISTQGRHASNFICAMYNTYNYNHAKILKYNFQQGFQICTFVSSPNKKEAKTITTGNDKTSYILQTSDQPFLMKLLTIKLSLMSSEHRSMR